MATAERTWLLQSQSDLCTKPRRPPRHLHRQVWGCPGRRAQTLMNLILPQCRHCHQRLANGRNDARLKGGRIMLTTSRERRRGRLLRVSRKSGQIFISLYMRAEALNGFKAPNKRQQIIVPWRQTTSSLMFQISL